MDDKPLVAAFDFDGTITYRDTALPFVVFVAGWISSIWKFMTLIPAVIAYILGALSRQEMKERVFTRFFSGMAIDELKSLGTQFAKKRLGVKLKPEAMRRIEWHKKQGHRLVLVSASLDVYLVPWATLAGFDDILSSSLEVDEEGKVTGKLQGLNCRGLEKTRRLEALLGPRKNYELYAYGDSRGDRELLAYADQAFFRKMPVLEKIL